MTALSKGANAAVPHDHVLVKTTWTKATPSSPGIDASAFIINDAGKVLSDDHFVFFNNGSAPGGGVAWRGATIGGDFTIDFPRLPETASRVILAATVDGPPQPLSAYVRAEIRIEANAFEVATFQADLTSATEAAMVLGEFYRRNGAWRFRAVAQGFNGGLEPLAKQYGVDVEGASSGTASPPPPPASPTRAAPTQQNVNLSKLDLRKQKVGLILEKKGVGRLRANIAAIMDRSGSMDALYRRGVVQDTFERIVPIAMRLAPTEKVDTWFFASEFRKTPDCVPANLDGYVERYAPSYGGLFRRGDGIGFGNNETPCIRDVLDHFTKRMSTELPTLVLFFHDGGVTDSTGISRALKDASRLPLFWQFLGLGRGNFGILEQLDTMPGREVDNCNFFKVPDITTVTDDELYERLLGEFPLWITAARAKGILR